MKCISNSASFSFVLYKMFIIYFLRKSYKTNLNQPYSGKMLSNVPRNFPSLFVGSLLKVDISLRFLCVTLGESFRLPRDLSGVKSGVCTNVT